MPDRKNSNSPQPGIASDRTPDVPAPTVRRLPQYLAFLQRHLAQESGEQVSCTHIANDLGQTTSQIRKDLAYTGIVGRPKVGYDTAELIAAIERFLGWDNSRDAFMVGVGALGTALMGYPGFADRGLNIVAGFDVDEAKIGTMIHGREVYPIERMMDFGPELHVHIAVLAVPAAAVPEVIPFLTLSGIRAIWNFTGIQPEVPRNVIVENTDLSGSLALLSSRLEQAFSAE